MDILRIAAFSDGNIGGNPAGVVICDEFPSPGEMQTIAAQVGYSETVFSSKQSDGSWKTRYYSPESEVPFCGHATIALGAVLAEKFGPGTNRLKLKHADITVQGEAHETLYKSSLQSPSTKSQTISPDDLNKVLDLFSYTLEDLDQNIPPARIHGGADHIVLALKTREHLAQMQYDLDKGRDLMNKLGLITIMLVWAEDRNLFHVRNAFASGGVLEDPATGAAAAAFSGYLRDNNMLNSNEINIIQGEDMGERSLLNASFSNKTGSSIEISGTARKIL